MWVHMCAVGTELGVQALLVERRTCRRRADGLELFARLRFQIGHVASHPCERGDLAGECAPRPRQLVHHRDGKLVAIEGDPESPISRGRLCPKGAASHELLTHPARLTRVK